MTKLTQIGLLRTLLVVFLGLFGNITAQVRERTRGPHLATQIRDPLTIPIEVGTNVNVSLTNPKRPHTEVLAAAHPTDPKNLMVCTMIWSNEVNALTSGVYVSTDGGRSWKLRLEDRSKGGVWDPACAYGPPGKAYFSGIVSAEERKQARQNFYLSNDSGRSWSQAPRAPWGDRQFITVDREGPHRGRIYLHMGGDPATAYDPERPKKSREMLLYISDDEGKTFKGPAKGPTSGSVSRRSAIGGVGVLTEDGIFLAPYYTTTGPAIEDQESKEPIRRQIEVISSADGGVTVTEPTVVANIGLLGEQGCSPFPVMAVDRSLGAYRGRIYLLWVSLQGRARCTVFLAHSDDRGKTWSRSTVVDDALDRLEGNGPTSFLATLAVNRNGVVGVTWYDRRDDPKDRRSRLRFSASFDGGDIFTSSIPVSSRAFSYKDSEDYPLHANSLRARTGSESIHSYVNLAPRTYYGAGDTAGIAADADGIFHAFWLDNRTGTQQLFTAEVRVKAKAMTNGSTTLSKLENLSSSCQIRYTRTHYDRARHAITVSFVVRNESKQTIQEPLKLRIASLESAIGRAVPQGTENGVNGSGAVWDISNLLRDGKLDPGAETKIGKLTFRIREFRPLLGHAGRMRTRGIVEFDARIYGRSLLSP